MPTPEPGYSETGVASWYGPGFHGAAAANGSTYDQEALTARRDAVKLDAANTIAQRNFARALWLAGQNREEAAVQYQHAMERSPNDLRLDIEFDKLLSEMNATERRVKLLETAPTAVLASCRNQRW